MKNSIAFSICAALMVLFTFAPVSVCATGVQEAADPNDLWLNIQPDQEVTLTATIKNIGERPFTEYALIDEYKHEWNISFKEQSKFSSYDGKKITLTAKANGNSMPIVSGGATIVTISGKRMLSDIVIQEN